MDLIQTLTLLIGSSFLSGWSAYATVAFLGFFGWLGWLQLPAGLEGITEPWVFCLAFGIYFIEFLADKIPAVDTVWDAIHTFIRVPAGAVLAYAAVGEVAPELKLFAGLLGGSLAFSAHATKASIRALANMSPEPISNWILSLSENVLFWILVAFMIFIPILLLIFVALFVIFFIWFFRRIIRAFFRLFRPRVPTS